MILAPQSHLMASHWADLYAVGSNFKDAMLSNSTFQRMTLVHSCFIGACLEYVDFLECDLRYCALDGANLLNATIHNCDLTGAKYNAATKWPKGFDPAAAGAVLVEDDK